MEHLLNNPVYNALRSGDAYLSRGTEAVKFFDEAVSPFAGFSQDYHNGFDDLHRLLPPKRKILYATRLLIKEPKGWELVQELNGLQFVYIEKTEVSLPSVTLHHYTTNMWSRW